MLRCLVTAGPTREKIDRVRDWGNIFSGSTGLSIATALAEIADVDLLTSNTNHLAQLSTKTFPHELNGVDFASHAELKGELAALVGVRHYDAIFMTAAVSDYSPQRTYAVISRQAAPADPSHPPQEIWHVQDAQAAKVKSTHDEIAVLGGRTEKLVDLFRTQWAYNGLLVKFKLEVGITKEKLIEIGQASRVASGADYLVANTLDMVDGENAGAYLLSDAAAEWIPRAELASRMVRLVRK